MLLAMLLGLGPRSDGGNASKVVSAETSESGALVGPRFSSRCQPTKALDERFLSRRTTAALDSRALDDMVRSNVRDLPVDGTLRRIVALFRLLGWGWMAILVLLLPVDDPEANMDIAGGTLAIVTAWTAYTVWAAARGDQLSSAWFVLVDIAIALLAGAATTLSGAQYLFHGGYPMSTLAVTAYAFNFRATLVAAFALAGEQLAVHIVDGRGVLPAVGSVTFVVFGILPGWAFDNLRLQERRRLEVQEELVEANAAGVRHEERIDLANRLHDSVLQTLTALRRDAEDPSQVRYLARSTMRNVPHARSVIGAARIEVFRLLQGPVSAGS